MASPSPSIADCLKLLRGERDEQKLAGLLLATKFCQSDDRDSILQVYSAVGHRFLDRLLMTGIGKRAGGGSVRSGEEREAYLKLSVTVLAGFCRVPEIASSMEMISKVPVMAEVMSKSSDQSVAEECYEFLLLVAGASEKGKSSFYQPGVFDMLAPHVYSLQNDSQLLELAMRLLQLVLNGLLIDMIDAENITGLSSMVAAISRQFAELHNAFKFDALHLLSVVLSAKITLLRDALRSMPTATWASHVRLGITAVLQNRVVSREKLHALLLAESMMSILGEDWLVEQTEMHDNQIQMPVDKYMLLVLETARVEVAVLLNELAYSKYEASKSSVNNESILIKQRNLAITFSLIEKIIKLISHASEIKGSPLSESTLTKVVAGLNETINLVLDFLQDSKDHGQHRGDDLLAAVRIIGSYLAEAPFACKEKSRGLLEYMLLIEGDDESRPFYSICFLLPMLCQITVETEGCKLLGSFGGHKIVVECLIQMIGKDGAAVENYGTIFLACETILNILLKSKEIQVHLEDFQLVRLLQALALWTEKNNDPTTIMMASCICSLIFALTSEESLLKRSNLEGRTLEALSQIIAISFSQAELSYDVGEHLDLHEIVTAAYSQWSDRYPLVRTAVERALNLG
ncbi:neurochondrin isoform X2 [Asparagus officinalis]|uniref:neurochondrin isoform X1 n=1 Tax=Asparagus officinalis TaxID=4686 RepID=UPI00098E8248|nr:neurochondrin isoform X1 [Asparagus officinalis]XP_020241642.1 neurochondrin isoform X2 [Asparagus officinalis]